MDNLLTQVEDRHRVALPRMKAQYLLSYKIGQLTAEMMEDIKQEYAPLIDGEAVDVELEVWRHKIHVAQGAVFEKITESVDATFQPQNSEHSSDRACLDSIG